MVIRAKSRQLAWQWVVLALSVAAVSGCAGRGRANVAASLGNDSLKRAMDLAYQDMVDLERAPASAGSSLEAAVGPAFEQLRHDTRLLVFPRRTMISHKTPELLKSEYVTPQEFTFRATRLLNCNQLAKDPIKGFQPRTYFSSVAQDKSLQCAILSVKRTYPELKPAHFRNDLIGMNLYIDSNYRSYGTDTEVAYDRKDIRTASSGKRPTEALSSGLTLFPIDLPPNLSAEKISTGTFELPADPLVKTHLTKLGAMPSCAKDPKVMSYRDTLGQHVRLFWCPGDRWPTMIETNRFVAFLRKG